MSNILRLRNIDMENLIALSKNEDFPLRITEKNRYDVKVHYLSGDYPVHSGSQTYGYYVYDELVGVMTATYMYVFLHSDSPNGKVVYISGAYVHPDYRGKGIATELLAYIEKDSKKYFKADYLCCNSSADDLYKKAGFVESSESRLWKKLSYETNR